MVTPKIKINFRSLVFPLGVYPLVIQTMYLGNSRAVFKQSCPFYCNIHIQDEGVLSRVL